MEKKCDRCKKALTKENTADGVNGYEIRTIIPEASHISKAEEVCRSCFEEFRKQPLSSKASKE